MDYEKKYKQLHTFISDLYPFMSEYCKEKVEGFFPELKESENEQHRKWILEYLYDGLRKSDEQFKDQFKTAIAWFEKQGEKKPADKIESKFKIGDWIVSPGGCYLHILDIEEDGYLCEDILGEETKVLCEHPNCGFKLWTIEDAKDGVVLVSMNGCPFIYKKTDGVEARFYCCVDFENYFCVDDGTNHCGFKDSSKPATKEQRETLFKAMHEAGYEWDADKKELKKINSYCQENCKGFQETGKCYADGECKAKREVEQNPAWSVSDFRTWQYIVSDVLTKKNGIGQYLDSGECQNIAKYMQEEWSKKLSIEQNPAWSEEDEQGFSDALWAIQQSRTIAKDENDMGNLWYAERWLKSIKDRVQSKQEYK